MNGNYRIDTYIDENLYNVEVSRVVGLLNSHTPPKLTNQVK